MSDEAHESPLVEPDVEPAEAIFEADTAGDVETLERAASLWGDAWRQLRRRWIFWIAAGLISLFTIMAIVPQVFVVPSPATHDPRDCGLRAADGTFQDRLRPSSEHWFGTDLQGCDYFARVIHGARVSIVIGIGVTALAGLIGLTLGGIAGFYGGWFDQLISRFVDVLFAIPFLVAAILFLNVIATEGERNIGHLLLVLGVFGWPTLSRQK